MTRAIQDSEKINQRQIAAARRRTERELKHMQSAHDARKSELKKSHAQEILDIQHAHHDQVFQEAEKKQNILSQMRSHLQQTKELTDKQLKALQKHSEKEIARTQESLLAKQDKIFSENALSLEELSYTFSNSAKKISEEGKGHLEKTKAQLAERDRKTKAFYLNKISSQTDQFTTRLKQNALKYQNLKDSQDDRFKNERKGAYLRQQTQLNKMSQTHQNHLEQRDHNYRQGLKDQDKFFEKKYEHQILHHHNHFKRLEEKNAKLIQELKASLSQKISQSATLREDPFYQLETLKPRVKNFEDRIEIEVDIPDYSKQDLQLTINHKEAILNFGRRFSDAVKLPDGTLNKVNKVETSTTRVPTSYILDAKSVKSSFKDGVMTYVIKKA